MKAIKSAWITLSVIGMVSTGVKAQTSYLDIGSKVKNYPQVEWLQGKPVSTFEHNKIYIIELWATWCVPCIIQMPHVNDLATKFKDTNVVFIGQNVMETDKAKVLAFLERKKSVVTYAIAFGGGSGSHFDKEWLKPAGVSAIPQTFIIKEGRLVWQSTPDKLNEELIRSLIDGSFSSSLERSAREDKKD
ncbi:TlpA family protein disulfide reductase [Mucilaginibacter conchicola]|uniref:TlpA family protein disulfide reductase n=1 Tax=Mucilaginibacter conchicola TaxID=2303333 RepID=A0A372NQR9_9SPHI|nr:TlpA disulfide reductase family protein [Mucilaginibacter conchicola]RFZ91188.1 TlpA family protein disulfide reductase [Mucilaginibacter conchicola]